MPFRLLAVLALASGVSVALAQKAPPPADGEFLPFAPAAELPPHNDAAAAPSAQTQGNDANGAAAGPDAQPTPPAQAQPAPGDSPAPEAQSFEAHPMEPAPAAGEPAPAAAPPPPSSGDADRCRESGPPRGLTKLRLPAWGAGAVAGGAVGAVALAAVMLVVAGTLSFAVFRGLLPPTPLGGLFIYLLPVAALPVGALMGAVLGGVVAPFLPNLGLSRPCVSQGDPTLRRNGAS